MKPSPGDLPPAETVLSNVVDESVDYAAAERAYARAAAVPGAYLEPFSRFRPVHVSPFAQFWTTGAAVDLSSPKHQFKGSGHYVFLGTGVMPFEQYVLYGANNVLAVGPHVQSTTARAHLFGSDSLISIGGFSTINGTIQTWSDARSIVIGERCFVGEGVIISNSDTHGIYDKATGLRLNQERDIVIGDRVFLGYQSLVGKGAVIEAGAIVTERSVATGRLEGGAVYSGVPALRRSNDVVWFHPEDARETLEESLAAEEHRIRALRDALSERTP